MDSGLPSPASRASGPGMTRPHQLILRIEPAEFLHPLAGIDLGRGDVALAVDRDVVHHVELPGLAAGPAYASEHLVGAPVDDAQLVVHAVHHVDELLLR